MGRYLAKNDKEFEWIQLYLFDKGFSWRGSGNNLLVMNSTDYPIIVIIENRDIVYGRNWKYREELLGLVNISVSRMMIKYMRKDKIVKLNVRRKEMDMKN